MSNNWPNEPLDQRAGLAAGRATGQAAAGRPPVLEVVRGRPTAEELAATVAVLGALAGRAATASRPQAPPTANCHGWNDRTRLVRRQLQARPGGWQASGLPGGEFA
jgi:acyl-CoA carboxylase epsilon subunit